MKNLMLFGRVFVALWFIVALLDLPSANPEGAPIDCNSFCKHPGKCQTDSGKCLCYVGWTGPNAFYIDDKNHVLADYCTEPCFYSEFFRNLTCASDTPTTTTRRNTTRSPAELCGQLRMAQSLLKRLKSIFLTDRPAGRK